MFKADRAEARGEFDEAIAFLARADSLYPLPIWRRAHRALLMLRGQHLAEAKTALAHLRADLAMSNDPQSCYLRIWSLATLHLVTRAGLLSAKKAQDANALACSRRIKRRFPIPAMD